MDQLAVDVHVKFHFAFDGKPHGVGGIAGPENGLAVRILTVFGAVKDPLQLIVRQMAEGDYLAEIFDGWIGPNSDFAKNTAFRRKK